ncbi:hypothetical protein CO662_35900 [Rhizobium anhuiense]|uniref:Uncharacterized protein n=2 Tax=Rhizobium TaxID=379 RepID=A0A3S0XM97_9HYPH|nr:hypothetical protein CO665_33525 [Rhizobium anhuiense]PDS77278.1 hypothetical protein CO654_34420 [Rhizobium sp. L18]PDT26092.1 hypothetical protein CO660_29965 [Rhizobium sp. L9]PDV84819.1 hypothetical protein CO652_29990 [Rhizobium sp. H4]RSB86962.1 hypothetical protein EFR00_27750 [Rhizobium sophoriradicis]RUM01764.1 hypothetical protein EFR84_21990 [Rhizobium chutanense]
MTVDPASISRAGQPRGLSCRSLRFRIDGHRPRLTVVECTHLVTLAARALQPRCSDPSTSMLKKVLEKLASSPSFDGGLGANLARSGLMVAAACEPTFCDPDRRRRGRSRRVSQPECARRRAPKYRSRARYWPPD